MGFRNKFFTQESENITQGSANSGSRPKFGTQISFIQFRARKWLLSIVVLRLIFNYDVFYKKLYTHEIFESREFRNFFVFFSEIFLGSLEKVFANP